MPDANLADHSARNSSTPGSGTRFSRASRTTLARADFVRCGECGNERTLDSARRRMERMDGFTGVADTERKQAEGGR